MPEAASEAQRRLFGLALAYKMGKIPDSQVTSNIRQIADETSIEDLRRLASTPTDNLPYKVSGGGEQDSAPAETPEKQDEFMQMKETGMGAPSMPSVSPAVPTAPTPMGEETDENKVYLKDIIGRFVKLGETFRREPMQKMALELAQMAEMAEHQLVEEEGNDWYDKHTIGRNVKEMKAYAKEFEKLAQEADEFSTRMQALYQDMSRVLERYFDVYDPAESPTGEDLVSEPQPEQECGSTMRESSMISEDDMTRKALPIVRKKLSESQRILFDRLPSDTKRKVIWRLL